METCGAGASGETGIGLGLLERSTIFSVYFDIPVERDEEGGTMNGLQEKQQCFM